MEQELYPAIKCPSTISAATPTTIYINKGALLTRVLAAISANLPGRLILFGGTTANIYGKAQRATSQMIATCWQKSRIAYGPYLGRGRLKDMQGQGCGPIQPFTDRPGFLPTHRWSSRISLVTPVTYKLNYNSLKPNGLSVNHMFKEFITCVKVWLIRINKSDSLSLSYQTAVFGFGFKNNHSIRVSVQLNCQTPLNLNLDL